VARAIHASDRWDFDGHIEDAGKCGLDETGKYPVNRNDEEILASALIRDAVIARSDSDEAIQLSCCGEGSWIASLRSQ
jgi:hypothetical protein